LIDELGRRYCTLKPLVGDAELQRSLIRRNPFVHSSVMFRRTLLEVVGRYNEDLITQDYDFWLRAARYTRMSNLPQILVCLRKADDNMSYRQYHLQARETLQTQLWAIRQGWYSTWNVIWVCRSAIYLAMPPAVYRVAMKLRRLRHLRRKVICL
jgi:hypothetical protein